MSCRDCFSGTLHSGTPKGSTTRLHGLNTYVAEPPSADSPLKGIVVVIPDLFGWETPNSRCLADEYARKGNFRVYLPDFMDGHACSAHVQPMMEKLMDAGLWANIMKIYYLPVTLYHALPSLIRTRTSISHPRVVAFLSALRENEASALPVGAAGFCWGGKHVALLTRDSVKAANGLSLIDAGFTGHPSQLKLPEDMELVKLPLSVAVGPEDMALGKENLAIMQTVLSKKVEVETEVVVYDGAKHGFCIRGDPTDEKQNKQGHEAEDQAVAWFGRWFAQWRGLSQ
ncbi:MAG: hypothetical protein M1819_005831 [Sarea resinae]|nr:MAG: hypothetical protein M1819_005831 [Sarea resinae]